MIANLSISSSSSFLVISLRVKQGDQSHYRNLSFHLLALKELKSVISKSFGKREEDIKEMVLLPDTLLCTEQDLLRLKLNDEVQVIFQSEEKKKDRGD